MQADDKRIFDFVFKPPDYGVAAGLPAHDRAAAADVQSPARTCALHGFLRGYRAALVDQGRPASDRLLVEFRRWLAGTEEGRAVGSDAETPWWVTLTQLDPATRNILIFYRWFERFLNENHMGEAWVAAGERPAARAAAGQRGVH